MWTVLISAAVSAVLGGGAGFLSARVHERLRQRERLSGIAGALWADLQRIRQELGEPKDHYFSMSFYGSRPIPPEIHEWTRNLVPEVAQIHPQIVVDFFRLERALINHRSSVNGMFGAFELRSEAQEKEREADEAGIDKIAEKMKMEREVRRAHDAAEFWEASAVRERKRAWEIMDDIEGAIFDFLPTERKVVLDPKIETPEGDEQKILDAPGAAEAEDAD